MMVMPKPNAPQAEPVVTMMTEHHKGYVRSIYSIPAMVAMMPTVMTVTRQHHKTAGRRCPHSKSAMRRSVDLRGRKSKRNEQGRSENNVPCKVVPCHRTPPLRAYNSVPIVRLAVVAADHTITSLLQSFTLRLFYTATRREPPEMDLNARWRVPRWLRQ